MTAAGLVLCAVCCGLGLADTSPLTPPSETDEGKTEFAFEDIWNTTFLGDSFNGYWVQDSLVFTHPAGDVLSWDPATGEKLVLVDETFMKNQSVGGHSFSHDLQQMLYSYDYKQQWRYSFKAKYKIFNRLKNGTDEAVVDFPNSPELSGQTLDYAGWAPQGTSLVFVHKNDLYFQNSTTGGVRRLTHTGDDLLIYNGVPDWLYEEEIVADRKAVYWSPDARHLIYATFNDTGLPFIEFPVYGPSSDVYGETARIPYPKAGYRTETGDLGPTSVATLHIIDMRTFRTRDVPVPEMFRNVDRYYLQVTWVDDTDFTVLWSNRAQNHSVTSLCRLPSLQCAKHLETKYPGGWIRMFPPRLFYIDGGRHYVTTRSRDEGMTGGWTQVAVIPTKMNADNEIMFLTRGEREVYYIAGVDQSRRLVYYVSNEGNPKDRQLFRVGLEDADPALRPVVCLTCGGECNYNSVHFNMNATYYLRQCYGPGVPQDFLVSLTDPPTTVELVNNSALREAVNSKLLPTRGFLEVPVGGGYMAYAEVFYPPGFSEDKKYPLLIVTYGGPGSQEVTDHFKLQGIIERWTAYLGSVYHVIVASVDGRGAGGRGDRYRQELYRRMGTVEVEDQAYLARYLSEKPYVDSSKGIAIYGWSYGGEVSSHAVADYPIFTCAIAVAPVVSKRYYDTAYTERVMGFDLPTDNEAGYNNSDISRKAANMTDKKYMLIHGTQDDNVHFMNTAQMVKALTDAKVQFQFEMYVDEPHSLHHRPASRRHLFTAMTRFLHNDCWDMSPDPQHLNAGGALRMCVSLVLTMTVIALL